MLIRVYETGRSPMVAHEHNGDKEPKPVQDEAEKADRIARHLKAVYEETIREPVPDELLNLLKKLGDRD